jgi:fructose-bisphosphate aldolase class I
MNTQALVTTAKMMVTDRKGLVEMDKSTGTCNKRFSKWGDLAA